MLLNVLQFCSFTKLRNGIDTRCQNWLAVYSVENIEMSYKFSIKIDNQEHSLTKEDGIPIESVGEILTALAKAINFDSTKVTLEEIRGNCYAMDFTTTDERPYNTFYDLHTRLEVVSEDDLSDNEALYAKALRKVIRKHGVYVEALNSDRKRIAKITDLLPSKEASSIHYHKTIYGTIISFGGKNENKSQAVVEIYDGTKLSIFLSKDHEFKMLEVLRSVYKQRPIRMKVRVKVSQNSSKKQYFLESFHVPSKTTLYENISLSIQNQSDVFGDLLDSESAVRGLRNGLV